jgi:plastocyanin
MPASRADYRKPATRRVSVLTPSIRHVNTATLAFVMFVAVALLSSTHGKNSETREPASFKPTKTEIVIDNFSFSPKEITVPTGATVTWNNDDNVPDAVTSADDQLQKSPVLKAGQSFSNTFATAGTYFTSVPSALG